MKSTFVLVLSLFCLNMSAQKGKVYQNTWYNEGKDASGEYSYFEKGKLYYVLSNDNDNICVDIRVEDAGVQTRILKEGMTIWIDMDGKLARKMGIRFPLGSEHQGGRPGNGLPHLNADGTMITPLSQANTIELIGFSSESEKRFPSDNPDTFRGYVRYDKEGNLHYRLIMPVVKLPVRNSKDSKEANPFCFGIEYGFVPAMTENRGQSGFPSGPASSGGGGSRGGGGGGGSRGGGGGGSRGGSSGFGGGTRNTGSSSTSAPGVIFWVKNIKMATAN